MYRGGRDPMVEALMRGNIAKFERMLKHEPGLVHRLNSQGKRAIHVIAHMGHILGITIIIKHGADVNALDASGNQAIHYVAGTAQTTVLEALLKAGANANAVVASTGIRAIHLACQGGSPEPIRLLLQYGADPNFADCNQRNAFDYFFEMLPMCGRYADVAIVASLLFSAGCTKGNQWPLTSDWIYSQRFQFQGSHAALLDYLLTTTWHSPGQRDAQGFIVHSSGVFARGDLLLCLLRHGLDPNERDANGETIMGQLTRKAPGKGTFLICYDAFRALICAGLDLTQRATPKGITHARFIARECPLGLDLNGNAADIRRQCAARLEKPRKVLTLQKIP